jgi:uncharacterized damage-inducible protein DinB
MSTGLSFDELIEYTDWERGKWQDWLRQRGDAALATSAGAHGDGRFQTIGDLVRHIFSAEKRYIERLSNRPLTDTSSVSTGSVDALFEFGAQSRAELKKFVKEYPMQDWDLPQEFDIFGNYLKATPRKLVAHVLMHEIRHWSQISTMFRLNGMPIETHDFLFSPVLGGESRRAAK